MGDDSDFLPIPGWPRGAYGRIRDNTGLIVVSELPDQPDTLLLRLMGTGEVQRKAIKQLLQVPPESFEYVVFIHLANLHGELMHQPFRNAEEEQFIQNSRELFEKYMRDFEEETRNLAAAALVIGQLEVKFGKLPAWRLVQVEQASFEQNSTWAERLLTAATLDAVFDGAVARSP